MILRKRILKFLEKCGLTPLCEVCEYQDDCQSTIGRECKTLTEIEKVFKKCFKEVND